MAPWPGRRMTGRTLLVALLILATARVCGGGPTVDCSERFPVGSFALTLADVAPLVSGMSGFRVVHILKKPLPMEKSGSGDACEFVYAGDVFELAAETAPGSLVAGCAGDFQGRGVRDFAVLLRRAGDARYVPHVFLKRGPTFEVVELEAYASDDSGWFGPFCQPKPQNGIFRPPDFEGTGRRAEIPVVGDLITVGWWTYYWRPDVGRFGAVLTTD